MAIKTLTIMITNSYVMIKSNDNNGDQSKYHSKLR